MTPSIRGITPEDIVEYILWYMNIFASGAGREDRIYAALMDRLTRPRPFVDLPDALSEEPGDGDWSSPDFVDS